MLYMLSNQLKEKLKELWSLARQNMKDHAIWAKERLLIPENRKPYLEGRIVWCADCGCKRQLTALESSSVIVCDTCHGHNWMYFTRELFRHEP